MIREEWPYLVTRFSLNDRYLGRLPKEVTKEFSSQFLLNEMKDFFDKYPQAGAGKIIFKILCYCPLKIKSILCTCFYGKALKSKQKYFFGVLLPYYLFTTDVCHTLVAPENKARLKSRSKRVWQGNWGYLMPAEI